MTTAEKYRQLEKSPVINIARFIFNDLKAEATNTTLEKVIADIKTGKTPSKQQKRFYEDDYFDWFKPDEIGSKKYLYNSKDKVSKFAFETKQATIFEPDTILINAIGDVGRISILKKQASSNQQITGIRLKDEVFVDYVYFYLLAHREYFYVDLFQTTLPIVNQKKINTIPFCYPPLNEQKNIVEGLEEIEKIKSINDLHIIENLNWKKDYKEISRNFFNLQFGTKKIVNELTHQLDLIKQLRQAFLREAMQGKLVKSWNIKETGQQLLERIKAEKEQLIAEKILKKEKELSLITEDEIPFGIPEHWAWCRLGDVVNEILGGYAFDSTKYSKTETDNQIIRLGNVKPNKLVLDANPVFINDEYANGANKSMLKVGDVLITMTGTRAKRDYLFSLCLFEDDFKIKNLFLNQRVGCFRFPELISTNFINVLLKDSKLIEPIFESSTGAANQANIGITALRETILPLPPLHEQEQIVAKLEELMAFCDGLEQSIKESQGYNEKLLQQVLREALQGKEESKM